MLPFGFSEASVGHIGPTIHVGLHAKLAPCTAVNSQLPMLQRRSCGLRSSGLYVQQPRSTPQTNGPMSAHTPLTCCCQRTPSDADIDTPDKSVRQDAPVDKHGQRNVDQTTAEDTSYGIGAAGQPISSSTAGQLTAEQGKGEEVHVTLTTSYQVHEGCGLELTQELEDIHSFGDKYKVSDTWTAVHLGLLWLYTRRRLEGMERIWDVYTNKKRELNEITKGSTLEEQIKQVEAARVKGEQYAVQKVLPLSRRQDMVATLTGEKDVLDLKATGLEYVASGEPPESGSTETQNKSDRSKDERDSAGFRLMRVRNEVSQRRGLISRLLSWAEDQDDIPEVKKVESLKNTQRLCNRMQAFTPNGEKFAITKLITVEGPGVPKLIGLLFSSLDKGNMYAYNQQASFCLQGLAGAVLEFDAEDVLFKRISADMHRHLPLDRPTTFTLRIPQHTAQQGSNGSTSEDEGGQQMAMEYTGTNQALRHLVSALEEYVCNNCQKSDRVYRSWLPRDGQSVALVQMRRDKKYRSGDVAAPHAIRALDEDGRWQEAHLTDRQLWALVDIVDQYLKETPQFMRLYNPNLRLSMEDPQGYRFAREKARVWQWLQSVVLMTLMAVPLYWAAKRYITNDVMKQDGRSAATSYVIPSQPSVEDAQGRPTRQYDVLKMPRADQQDSTMC